MLGYPLQVTLNVQPQNGIDECDSRYQQFADLIGFNTSANGTIPCNLVNRDWAEALFATYFDTAPLASVDFWWTDMLYGARSVSRVIECCKVPVQREVSGSELEGSNQLIMSALQSAYLSPSPVNNLRLSTLACLQLWRP